MTDNELITVRQRNAELEALLIEHKKTIRRLQNRSETLEQTVAERTAQLEIQVEQLTALNFIMQMLTTARNLHGALEVVAQEMTKLFNATSCGVALMNEDRTAMKVVTSYTPNPELPKAVGLEIPLEGDLSIVNVVESGQAILINDPQINPLTTPLHDFLRRRNAQSMMLLPLLARGRVIGVIGVENDNPDRQFTQDEIMLAEMVGIQMSGMIERVRLADEDLHKAYEQLQALDRLKTAFIGVITHELRSPFVAASLSVELIERYAQKQMINELQNQVKELGQELAEGRAMIDHIIAYAELMSKQTALHLESTDFAALIKQAINPLLEMAGTRQVELSLQCDSNMPPVKVDQEKMSEVIYHLVHNAIKFNHQGGKVQIECRASNSQLVFKVKDTGDGLTNQQLSTIWEAFTQSADDLKRGIEGLGLGLALVRFVVKSHGGQVAVTSKPGQGSVFGFTLPLT